MKNPDTMHIIPTITHGKRAGAAASARRTLGLSLLVTLLVSACATLPGATPQDQVRARATQRWQALMAYDYAKAYEFATPAYRALVTPDAYRSRQGAALLRTSAKVFSVECPKPDTCTARVEVGVKSPLGKRYGSEIIAPVDESWVLQNGQWWLAERL